MLTEIAIENFRCFHAKQTARLAPLTLLVGENSTGKTSFMAMIRAMWDLAYSRANPNFKTPPYDLGSFDEIVHRVAHQSRQSDTFTASIGICNHEHSLDSRYEKVIFCVKFARRATAPMVMQRHLSADQTSIDLLVNEEGEAQAYITTSRGKWEWLDPVLAAFANIGITDADRDSLAWASILTDISIAVRSLYEKHSRPMESSPELNEDDFQALTQLAMSRLSTLTGKQYASAPVRSRPQRTYDPDEAAHDPYGNYVPMYLAEIAMQNLADWESLKSGLEKFGRSAHLFDEIRLYRFDKKINSPFQLQVRKGSKERKGQWHNLIDVGYGISQVLPVITELIRPDAPQISLWQEPEVHLHPSAQAALATFFCNIAAEGKQLIIETHGDYLIDRVRMDIRDNKTTLKPEDVSILYFERIGLDVQIHSLRFDAQGNVLDAPSSYRQFFLEEVNRSLGLT